MQNSKSFLALDVGTKRIGVATARADVRIASPLTTLEHGADILEQIVKLANDHEVDTIVVGLPRGLNGQTTEQTKLVERFAAQLKNASGKTIVLQDEALTSVKAEIELAARKAQTGYNKSDVDALAATYILEDYLNEHQV